jgi:predicted kinase
VQPALIALGGGACAGKTRLGHELVRQVPNALLLDKDFILGKWVDRLLTALHVGVDRDSPTYLRDVRPLEYEILEAVALDHLAMGKIAVMDAPLAPELNDAGWVLRMRQVCRLRGAAFLPVWVRVSPETAYRRLQARAELRDQWKLAHWNEFLARHPYETPTYVDLVLDNEDGATTCEQIERLVSAIAQKEAR